MVAYALLSMAVLLLLVLNKCNGYSPAAQSLRVAQLGRRKYSEASMGSKSVPSSCRLSMSASDGEEEERPVVVPIEGEKKEESAFDKVASMGLAGILAITAAEAIFWAAGVPLAALYYKYTTGEWIDIMSTDGQLKAAGFSFGYGGFATVILQYRVTIFAIPLVPFMQKYVVEPGKKIWGENWGDSNGDSSGGQGKGSKKGKTQYTILGATGGVGQCIASKILSDNDAGSVEVRAITRNVESAAAAAYPMLEGCQLVEADAGEKDSLPSALEGSDYLIISVGTTAFPSKKWGKNNKNDPKAACLDSVNNVLDVVKGLSLKPNRIVLISSIGVERANDLPFSILNSFGVLDYKRQSEEALREFSASTDIQSIIIRPGRLVGAPFTNYDLAALLKLDQGSKKRIILSPFDDVAADTQREDVAATVCQALTAPMSGTSATFSIVNAEGAAESEEDLAGALSGVLEGEGASLSSQKNTKELATA